MRTSCVAALNLASVVLATFGRAYWVLDNLQFLEQLSSAHVADNSPYLFKPQQTWLVKRSGGRRGTGGENKPVGATVFFHLPADYRSGDLVKLTFTTADGKLVRSFNFPYTPPASHSGFGRSAPKPIELHAGMNRFQWNLRYPNAVDVNGILWNVNGAKEPVGPEVVPGTYDAVLSYADSTQKQAFVVKLDPRLHTPQSALEQRFALQMRLHDALNQLDTEVNQALATRDALDKAIAAKSVSGQAAQQAYASLNQAIDDLVNLRIQSSEGGLMFKSQLHAFLTSINQQVDMQYEAPTPGMTQVADMYIEQAGKGVNALKSELVKANSILRP